jgi:hypothetical protein
MTVIAVVSIFYGLKDAQAVRRWPLAIGFGLLVIVCLLTAFVSTQEWGGMTAGMTGIYFLSIIVIIASVVMLVLLPKWRKTVVLLVGVAFPILFLQSILIGSEGSPDTITRKNGVLIAQALKAYHVDHHTYPATLEELVPKYLATIPAEPESTSGWLYKVTDDDFALGYVSDVEKFGYWVCIYTATATDWECPLPTFIGEPFNLGPTPMPTTN